MYYLKNVPVNCKYDCPFGMEKINFSANVRAAIADPETGKFFYANAAWLKLKLSGKTVPVSGYPFQRSI